MTSAFDSNIVIYAMAESVMDFDKPSLAREIIQTGGIISVQVLNEVAHVALRKLSKTWHEINYALDIIREFCDVVPVTVETHDEGRYIAERYKLSVFDAMIVAAASLSSCEILYSEDMQDGLVIDGTLRVCNPFIRSDPAV
jgi:predicted nucleic acid-binding protein